MSACGTGRQQADRRRHALDLHSRHHLHRGRQPVDFGGRSGQWLPLAFDGVKQCVDSTVPAGVTAANDQVRVTRGSEVSPWSAVSGIRYTADGGSAVSELRIAA